MAQPHLGHATRALLPRTYNLPHQEASRDRYNDNPKSPSPDLRTAVGSSQSCETPVSSNEINSSVLVAICRCARILAGYSTVVQPALSRFQTHRVSPVETDTERRESDAALPQDIPVSASSSDVHSCGKLLVISSTWAVSYTVLIQGSQIRCVCMTPATFDRHFSPPSATGCCLWCMHVCHLRHT
jgi:hypothetical protein